MIKPRVCRSYQGGAAHGLTLQAADEELDLYTEGVAFSGASVGSLIALANAFDIPKAKTQAVMRWALTDNHILDVAPFELGDGGICAGRALRDMVGELLGAKTTLGEAAHPVIVGATDLDTGLPRYLGKRLTPRVLVVDCVVGAYFPGVFPFAAIPSLSTVRYQGNGPPLNERLHTDLGVVDNTVDHVWDSIEHPARVHLRLVGDEPPRHVRLGDPLGQGLALLHALTYAASRLKSQRTDGIVVDVPRIGDGLDFSADKVTLDARVKAGRAAVAQRADHLRALGGAQVER